MRFCEDPICAWIAYPANTWSTLGYVAIGIWLILKARQLKITSLNVIGWSCLLTGIFAFIYHAGGTLLFQTLDLAGMYLFSSTLIILNLRRLGWIENKVILKSIWPSKVPPFVGMTYAGRTYKPLLIESCSSPLVVERDQDLNRLFAQVTINVTSHHALDAPEWAAMR